VVVIIVVAVVLFVVLYLLLRKKQVVSMNSEPISHTNAVYMGSADAVALGISSVDLNMNNPKQTHSAEDVYSTMHFIEDQESTES